jgi:hypothetical protein
MATNYNIVRKYQMTDKRKHGSPPSIRNLKDAPEGVFCKFCGTVGYPFCSENCKERWQVIHDNG